MFLVKNEKNLVIFCIFFFPLLPKFNDFKNPDDYMKKMTSKSTRLYPVFIQTKIFILKKRITSSEKMRNSGNYNNSYDHSFFGKNF